MWTTHKELAWLTDRIPKYRRVQASRHEQIQMWLRTLAPLFLAAFPEHAMKDMNQLVKVSIQYLRLCVFSPRTPFQRLRSWYSYHPDQLENAERGESLVEIPATLPLSLTHKQKKPATVAPWQAYSQLYFKKGTPLHKEIHLDYEDLKAGDSDTISKYAHLIPNLGEDPLRTTNWLPFYQAVMTDHIKNASEAERAAIEEHIKTRHQKELDLHERPWNAYPGGENDTEESRKKRYHEM